MQESMQEQYNQFESARTLDAIIVLGGEGKDHSRTNHAFDLYDNTRTKRYHPFNTVLSGDHSGDCNALAKSEAQMMFDYLTRKGMPQDILFKEDRSLDTIGNMIFSQQILNQILATQQTKKIGIVTDDYHMNRGVWLAKRIMGTRYDVTALPTGKQFPLQKVLFDKVITKVMQLELLCTNIEPGDLQGYKKYIQEKHPFHSGQKQFTPYGIALELCDIARGR